MSFRNSLIFLAIINILCFHFGGFRIGMISCFVTLYKILSYLGLTTTPQIFQNHFRPGVCYIKDFTGPYSSHGPKFGECAKLIKDNNLRDFSVIAFYYDDPLTVPKEKLRCSIGLYKKNLIPGDLIDVEGIEGEILGSKIPKDYELTTPSANIDIKGKEGKQ